MEKVLFSIYSNTNAVYLSQCFVFCHTGAPSFPRATQGLHDLSYSMKADKASPGEQEVCYSHYIETNLFHPNVPAWSFLYIYTYYIYIYTLCLFICHIYLWITLFCKELALLFSVFIFLCLINVYQNGVCVLDSV